MKSLYVLGGAATGKSTFTGRLLKRLGPLGPLEDLHSRPNDKIPEGRERANVVTLRGHRLPGGGVYLGKMRELHPGTDALDRASSPAAAEWLALQKAWYVVGEGATLATERFLSALVEWSDPVLILMEADEVTLDLHILQRGTAQKETFLKSTTSRSEKLFRQFQDNAESLRVDSGSPRQVNQALLLAQKHLVY